MKAKKSLGQNFLKDEMVLARIANLFSVNKNDLIIEVGPGMGALTKYLKDKGNVLAYEIDERMKSYLDKYSNVKVIYGDFLKTDFKELDNYRYDNLYVVANIPYYITTPIIEHFLCNGIVPGKMILLVQKEVALRFSAKPTNHDYGYFTVYLNHYFNVKKEFDVLPRCFVPAPKVTSSIVVFERKDNILGIDEEKFFKFVKLCFSKKRKTLKNNLSEYDFSKVENLLLQMGFDNQVRAESLSYEQFIEIFKAI